MKFLYKILSVLLSLLITFTSLNAFEINHCEIVEDKVSFTNSSNKHISLAKKDVDNTYNDILEAGNKILSSIHANEQLFLCIPLDNEIGSNAKIQLLYKFLETGTVQTQQQITITKEFDYVSKLYMWYVPISTVGLKGNYDIEVSITLANKQIAYNEIFRVHFLENENDSYNVIANGVCGENLTWSFSDTGELMIDGNGEMYNFKSQFYDEGCMPWKEYRKQIKRVVLNYGVESVGDFAFVGPSIYSEEQDSLNSVVLPETLIRIGFSSFMQCSNLEYLNFPSSLLYFGKNGFENCSSLKEIVIPKKVKEIPDYCFSNCSSVENIIFNDSLEKIGNCAFRGVSYRASKALQLYIPETVNYIGDCAFEYFYKLQSIIIKGNVTLGTSTFKNCEILNTIIFSKNVDLDYGSNRFSNLPNLKLLQIPFYVTNNSGEQIAFTVNNNFENTIIDTNNVVFTDDVLVEDGIVFSTDKTELLWYPRTLKASTYIIPEHVKKIGFSAFYEQPYLEHILIHDNVNEIGNWAFGKCSKLNNVIIPEGVEKLYCFQYCDSLESVVIPKSVNIMYQQGKNSQETFMNCQDLTMYYELGSYAQNFVEEHIESGFKGKEIVYCNFDANEGNLSKSKQAVIPQDKYWSLPTPTRYGYAFDGWYTSKSGGTKITEESIVSFNESFTLYAHWRSTTIKSISNCVVEYTSSFVYTGSNIKPNISVIDGDEVLKENIDYTISYTDNQNVGTATAKITGKSNYTGSINISYTIKPLSVEKCNIEIESPDFVYNGSAYRPKVNITANGRNLIENTDFSCTYANNINAGTAKIEISGKGNYKNTVIRYFDIVRKSITETSISLSKTSYYYDGLEKKPIITVTDFNTILKEGIDYEVTYNNNVNVGTATVNIIGLGNYKNNKNINFTIKKIVLENFTWGKDNWNFINSSTYFGNNTYREQMSQSYIEALKSNLTPSEYQTIFKGSNGNDGWIDDEWAGSCYGMAATTIIAKYDVIPYTDYEKKAKSINDLDFPLNNNKVSSLINYYQLLQIKSTLQQERYITKNKTHKENITKLINLLDNNTMVLVCFSQPSWGGHAVVAYGYEYGSWTKQGITYNGRIKINDPNRSSNKYNLYDDCYIYFNTKTYNWMIPMYYDYIMSVNGAKLTLITSDINDINEGGYHGEIQENKLVDYVARIDAYKISDERSVTKVINDGNSYYDTASGPDDIEEDYSFVINGESEGVIGYNLYDADSAYKIKQTLPKKMDLSIKYENCLMHAFSAAGEDVIFDNDGCVKVNSEDASFSISMTYDEGNPTSWFTLNASGDNTDFAELKKVDDGYILSANNLQNINVDANNVEYSAHTSFSTEYDSVFIYQVNPSTIGVKVDTDFNGTFETKLKTQTKTLSSCDLSLENDTYIYTGKGIEPVVTVKKDNKVLKKDIDYLVIYESNVSVGMGKVIVEGIGKYSGKQELNFDIIKNLTNIKNFVVKQKDYKTVSLSWEKVKGAISYDIYRKGWEDGACFKLLKTVDSNSANVTGLMTGKKYTYYIVAKNNLYHSEPSKSIAFSTKLTGNVKLSIEKINKTKFKLSWNKIDGATRYIIYRKRNTDSYKKVLTLGRDVYSYTTSELPNGEYSFIVKAARYDSKDRVMTDSSNTVKGIVEKPKPSITLTAGTKQIKVSWKKLEGVTYYVVYRASSENGKYSKLTTTKETSYISKSLTKGKEYYFKVRGYKSYNNGKTTQKIYTSYSSIKSIKAK